MLQVTVAMHARQMPDTKRRGNLWQRAHQRALQGEELQGFLTCRAVQALAGLAHDPVPGLGVQIGQTARLAQRQEVVLDIFDARLDDALLLWIVRRTGVDLEAIPFRALGVGALHDRIGAAGADDGALGIVDDHARRHRAEPLEGAAVAAQPGGYGLVPDKLDVLVAREGQCHDERPGATHGPMFVGKHRSGAEIDLRRLGRLEVQADGGGRGLALAQRHDQPIHRGIAARVAVIAAQRRVDRHALHTLLQPGAHQIAPGHDRGHRAARLAGLAQGGSQVSLIG